jgi:Fe2+ or Zn2+ uptake regulation protein
VASLADVFRELNALKQSGIVIDYALGGATAVLFFCGAHAHLRRRRVRLVSAQRLQSARFIDATLGRPTLLMRARFMRRRF